MRKIIILIFTLTIQLLFSQTIEVKYYDNAKIKNPELIKMLPQNVAIAFLPNQFSYTLINNGKESLYKNDDFNFENKDEIVSGKIVDLNGDSITINGSSKGFDVALKEKMYFKNFQKNKLYCEFTNSKKIQIIDSIVNWNWQLSDETEFTLGYKCKKATSSKQGDLIIAWYTDELSFSDGPQRFSGLPGLILKISTKGNDLVAYSIKIKEEKINLQEPIFEGKVYTYNELKTEFENKTNNKAETKTEFSKIDFSNVKSGDKIIIKTD